MKATDHIIDIIKREGAVTAKRIAERLGITTMGARQHLQSLEEDGLLRFEDVKVKVGRPNRHWSLTAQGHARFSDRHSDLTIQFIDAIENVFGSEGLEKVSKEREFNTLSTYQPHFDELPDLQSKVRKLTELREKDGYMAELEQTDDGFVLIENHCPICKAASRCEALCQSELNVFQALVGSDVNVERDEHIVKGARRCVYKFHAKQ
ncbi:transcriptional regulator [Vibrio sp. SCSIO 43140]|uniref:helix-turn-helix transcriptional regulator n=1 Tax=Vibrio sp. SCSIO 43140 TaxID=2819100 RepID=UPI002075CED4|nr:metalloregulator ArsR/SmtB family transcription factor [Vibrio sp. SCSIO 43140]USD60661.1 transcriptional regulator [Vibrio sp. SCSIO 43140]